MGHRNWKLILYIAFGYLLLFSFTYKALESAAVYNRFFSFVPVYENVNGTISIVNKPFTKITESGYNIMDASHYLYIRDHQYNADPGNEETAYNYAFFPLFPFVWKFFSGLGIVTLNYLLHFASILLLAAAFCRDNVYRALMVVLALPTLTVFLLPYTEALFIFSVSCALYGYTRNNKLLYFTGLAAASLTRPVFLLLICTLLATEVYQYLRKKEKGNRYLAGTVITILASTMLVAVYQYTFHHSSFFTFMSAQKHWGTFFRIPDTINDWSNEGFAMNIWALVFCFCSGSVILLHAFVKKPEGQYDNWYYFSWIYLLATCVYVLLFQGGCLHSLYRYTLCSPFFYVIIFQHIRNIHLLSFKSAFLILSGIFITCLICFSLIDYGKGWNFPKTGFVLLMLNLLLFISARSVSGKNRKIFYSILILGSVFWNCYLYNMFFSQGWIFL